jgi:hypothetical protein
MAAESTQHGEQEWAGEREMRRILSLEENLPPPKGISQPWSDGLWYLQLIDNDDNQATKLNPKLHQWRYMMRRRGGGRMMARRMASRMMRMRRRRHRRRRRRRIILVGGLIAVGVHKLSQKDVERVEEHTGKTAEDLTDEELEQAMTDLNIEAEELTDEEFDSVDKQDAADEAAEDDYIEQLERLGDMRDKGIITDEEFEAKKKELLDM